MDREGLESALVAVLHGEARRTHDLARAAPAELTAVAERLPPLRLDADAVAKTLTDLLNGGVSAQDAQAWASFVRRGYVAGSTVGSPMPLDIEYEPAMEDAIVEVVTRLDELGDSIDGEISAAEGRDLLALLQP